MTSLTTVCLHSWKSLRVVRKWQSAIRLSLKYWPLQYSYMENPMDKGAWWTIASGVAESPA